MPIRILIVDDEPHIRKVMRLTLESSGHEVGEAGTGEEALEVIGATKWDIVLLDERMPGIDGLETLRRLRARESDAVVIMVTAFASIELAVDAMKLGAIDFVHKPMSPETLRSAVDNALGKAWGGWPTRPSTPAAVGEHRFEMWTMNGFRVRHVADGAAATDNVFEVSRGRTGPGRQVAVQFARPVVDAASEEAGRRLDDDRAFWSRAGGLALFRHLWTHADTPADDRLMVAESSRDLLKAAREAAPGSPA
jgi:DNA-binding NtrC family response regulator